MTDDLCCDFCLKVHNFFSESLAPSIQLQIASGINSWWVFSILFYHFLQHTRQHTTTLLSHNFTTLWPSMAFSFEHIHLVCSFFTIFQQQWPCCIIFESISNIVDVEIKPVVLKGKHYLPIPLCCPLLGFICRYL